MLDLAPAGLKEGSQIVAQTGLHQAEHGLQPSSRAGQRDARRRLHQRGAQTRGQIGGQQRRIAGGGEQIRRDTRLQSGKKAGQRPRKLVRRGIGQHRQAPAAIDLDVAVRIEQHRAHLGPEPLQHLPCQRLAAPGLKAFVHPAHAAAAAPGENQAGDVGDGDGVRHLKTSRARPVRAPVVWRERRRPSAPGLS